MVQSNYFVEIRRRALEIDWRVPISIFEEGDLADAEAGDLLLNGRYLRIERDLLVVAPFDRGVLFHRFFDPEAPFSGSPLRLKPGQSIPMSWAPVMVSAPVLALDSNRTAPTLDSVPAAGVAVEAGAEPITLVLGGDYRLTVGADSRLWFTEGARSKGWAFKLLRGSVLCASLVDRPSTLRVETLRGHGRLSGGAMAAQMIHPLYPDTVLVTSFGAGEPTRWEMGGFGYSFNADKPALVWGQVGGGPDTVGLETLPGRVGPLLAEPLEMVLGKGVARADAVAKPYRAPKLTAKAGASGSASPDKKLRAPEAELPDRSVSSMRNGQAVAIAPITILDKPIHSIPKFDGDIELRVSVDQGVLYCRRTDLASVDGSGTGSLVLRGLLSVVNGTMGFVTFEMPTETSVKPLVAGGGQEKRPVMVTLFARIGGRLFETNLPLEQFLMDGASGVSR